MRGHSKTTLAGIAVALTALVAGCEGQPTATPDATLPALSAAPTTDFDLFFEDVEFRAGATADIHVRVYVKESLPCRDPLRMALAVPGVGVAATSWEPLADAFFAGSPQEALCLVAAIDHAGHGLSGLPQGVPFGELTVEDFARTVTETLDRLHRRGVQPTIVMGHSLGTLTITTMQQKLAEQGSNLRERFGVRDAVLFGTQGPMQLPTEFGVSPEIVGSFFALMTTTPEKGTFIQGPPEIFQLWFLNRDLAVAADAPSLGEIAANGWNSDIPLFALLQAASAEGFHPPAVDPAALAASTGTVLHLIHFTDDPWSLNGAAIYEYLTGDASLSGFIPITDPDNEAVHLYTITDPGVVRSFVDLPRVRAERAAHR